MIPLRDSTRSQHFPLVTVILIALNLFIFLQQSLSTPLQMEYMILHYGFTPALLTERVEALSLLGFLYPPLLTATFLHGSWFHVISNMLFCGYSVIISKTAWGISASSSFTLSPGLPQT